MRHKLEMGCACSVIEKKRMPVEKCNKGATRNNHLCIPIQVKRVFAQFFLHNGEMEKRGESYLNSLSIYDQF